MVLIRRCHPFAQPRSPLILLARGVISVAFVLRMHTYIALQIVTVPGALSIVYFSAPAFGDR